MKTTFDLPEPLVRKMKMRAVKEGRKLKEVARDALAAGLTNAPASRRQPATITRDRKTGLPVIQCKKRATLTPDDLAKILINQEAEYLIDAG